MAQIGDIVGEGFGRVTANPPVPAQDVGDYRREKMIRTMVGDLEVTVFVRDTIVPEDPILNMMRATAYTWQMGRGSARSVFPVPPISRDIKDALIKTNISV